MLRSNCHSSRWIASLWWSISTVGHRGYRQPRQSTGNCRSSVKIHEKAGMKTRRKGEAVARNANLEVGPVET